MSGDPSVSRLMLDQVLSIGLLMLTTFVVCYGAILLRREVDARRHDRAHPERVESCGMCAWRSWGVR